jgi:hypothetical protein
VQGAQKKTDAELDKELLTLRRALDEDKGRVRSAVEQPAAATLVT